MRQAFLVIQLEIQFWVCRRTDGTPVDGPIKWIKWAGTGYPACSGTNPIHFIVQGMARHVKLHCCQQKHVFFFEFLFFSSAVPMNQKVAPCQLASSGYIQSYDNFQGFINHHGYSIT